jgi:hypothetical protein
MLLKNKNKLRKGDSRLWAGRTNFKENTGLTQTLIIID